MQLNEQVCSLELSKRLHELGAPTYGLFMYRPDGTLYRGSLTGFDICDDGPRVNNGYIAYAVAELGMMLPDDIITRKSGKHWAAQRDRKIAPIGEPYVQTILFEETEADCRAKALIYCIENKLVKIGDINNVDI